MSKVLNVIKEIAAGMSASESYVRCSVAALLSVDDRLCGPCSPPRAASHLRAGK